MIPVCSTADRGRMSARFPVRSRVVIVVALLTVLVAGCTGGSGPATTGSGTTGSTGSTGSTASSTSAPSSTPRSTPIPGTTIASSTVPAGSGTPVPYRTVTSGSAEGVRIGLVAPSGSDPFSAEVATSIGERAKTAGITVISCDPGNDQALVLDCARRLATQQVQGWFLVRSAAPAEAVCAAAPKDAPLLVIASATLPCQTAEIGTDDTRAGELVGVALGQLAHDEANCEPGAIVLVADSANDPASARRIQGMQEALHTACPAAQPAVIDAGAQEGAHDKLQTALTALPVDSMILLGIVDDGLAQSIASGVPSDRMSHVYLAAVGADPRSRCDIIRNQQWLGDAALFPDRYGDVAVPALLDALAQRPVPPSMYVSPVFVTAVNLSRFYDTATDPSCPAS
jgi:ribose transport system substrate-binding protein